MRQMLISFCLLSQLLSEIYKKNGLGFIRNASASALNVVCPIPVLTSFFILDEKEIKK